MNSGMLLFCKHLIGSFIVECVYHYALCVHGFFDSKLKIGHAVHDLVFLNLTHIYDIIVHWILWVFF